MDAMTTTKKATKTRRPKAKATTAPKAKKVAVITPPSQVEEEFIRELAAQAEPTPEQTQAKINAYATLKNAGLEVPKELQQEVEAIVAAAKKQEREYFAQQEKAKSEEQKEIEQGNKSGRYWVRSAYNAPFSLRLERQSEGKKRIELKPRGQRGDMFPLQPEDLNDAGLQTNVEIGLIEIIGDGDAKAIVTKQTQNLQRTHTPLALLRNEKGEEYTPDAFKVEAEFNSQGVVVGVVDQSMGSQQENMKWGTGQRANAGGIIRTGQEQVSQFVPTGGNPAIISSGFPDKNTQAKVADDIARRKGGQGPSSAGILNVTVDPVQKV